MKKWIYFFGIWGLVANTILFYSFFFYAYLTKEKMSTLWINKYFEANFEVCLMLFFLPFIIITVIYLIKTCKEMS